MLTAVLGKDVDTQTIKGRNGDLLQPLNLQAFVHAHNQEAFGELQSSLV